VDASEALIRDLRKCNISDKSKAGRGCKWSGLRGCDLDAVDLTR
jgi:hypothetical protein